MKIGMLGDAATIEAVAEALDELPAGTPVVLDPVMVAESGARLLDEPTPSTRSIELLAAARDRRHAERPRGAGAHGRRRRDGAAGASSSRAVHALGPQVAIVTGGHRDEATDLVFDGGRSPRSPASATPTAPRTARAARTRARSPRTSRSATTRVDAARAARADAAARPSATACASSARAPGRSTSSACDARRAAGPRRARRRRRLAVDTVDAPGPRTARPAALP